MGKLKTNELVDQFNKIRELKIVRGEYKNRTPYFRVTGTVNNDQIDQRFKEKSIAKAFIEELKNKEEAKRSGLNSVKTKLSQEQIDDATVAYNRIPKGTHLTEIINFYLTHKPQEDKQISEAYELFIKDKKRIGNHVRSINEYEYTLKKFIKTHGYRLCSNITKDDVIKFITKGKVGRITQNNRQRVFNTFFNYCCKEEWITKNPIAKYQRNKIVIKTADYFRIEEVLIIFKKAAEDPHKSLLPYLTLSMLSGIRRSEIKKLDWSHIEFNGEETSIQISAEIAKTDSRRTITLEPFAINLLEYCNDNALHQPYPKNFAKRFNKLKRETGLNWSKNKLRHTFGTYFYAMSQDAETTAYRMGNSPSVLKKYYNGLSSKSNAEKFFNLNLF